MEQPSNTHEKLLISFPIEAEEKTIFLKLKKLNTTNMCYRLSSNMPMHTLLLDYCFRMGLVYEETKFSYNNFRVLETHTPDELKMSVGPVHIVTVFCSRDDTFIDLRCHRPVNRDQNPFMFLTLKPFDKGEDMSYYKYSRIQPLRWLMLDYCKRRAFTDEDVCFYYHSDSAREEVTTHTPEGSNTQKGLQMEIHEVIQVLPAASRSWITPDELQMNDYDVLTTVHFYTSKTVKMTSGGSATQKGVENIDTEEEEEEEEYLVRVVAINGESVYYKTSHDTPLCWIFLHYRDRMGFVYDEVRFIGGKGRQLDRAVAMTPKELKEGNQCVIHAVPRL